MSRIQPACFVHLVYQDRGLALAGPGLGLNPIGVAFEADEWRAARRNGEAESDDLPRTVHQTMSENRGNLVGA
jgi:hypothetical protein